MRSTVGRFIEGVSYNCFCQYTPPPSEYKTYTDGSLISGTPGKAVRTLSYEQIEGLRKSAQTHMDGIARYQVELEEVRE